MSQRAIEEVLDDIEDRAVLAAGNSHEISTDELGEMVLEKLYEIDRVAYVRFASVYRMFDNVDAFVRAIEELANPKESENDS